MTPSDDSSDAPHEDPAGTASRADSGDAGGDDAGEDASATAGGDAAPRRKRRRRRRRSEAPIVGGELAAEPGATTPPGAQAGERPQQPRRGSEPRRDDADRGRGRGDRSLAGPARPAGEPAEAAGEAAQAGGEPAPAGSDGDRGQRTGGEPAARGRDGRDDRGRGRGRGARGEQRGGDPRSGGGDPRGGGQRSADPRGGGQRSGGDPRGSNPRSGEQRNGGQRGGEQQRGEQPRGAEPRGGEPRGGDQRGSRGPRGEPRSDRGADPRSGDEPRSDRGGDARSGAADGSGDRYALLTSTFEGPTTRLDPRRPVTPTDDLDLEGPSTPSIPWGKDDDGPAADVVLAPDLPSDAPPDDPDPVSFPLADLPSAVLGEDVASVAGVRFVPGGRVQWCDAGDADYAPGERVMVDAERGARLAWIAVPPARRALRERGLRRVIRRATEHDLRGERDGDTERAQALRTAKDKAAALRLPLKVFRVELLGPLGRGGRLNLYYTTDERLDLRDFLRDVSAALGGARIELRQLGVRDEAKAVGGIGSCGLTLCCTTWLPDFVPVSIKMAKDQGLVLSPTKVSGQCGRLKCCLVYEQAGYAELRKGLPKLGKRVIAARGEGRVVEVDVLRQRIRVSYGAGDTEVVPAAEVKPLFPSGNQPSTRAGTGDPSATEETDDALASSGLIEIPASLRQLAEPSREIVLPDDLPDDGSDAASDTLPDDDPSAAT